jgi:hypothetical protein
MPGIIPHPPASALLSIHLAQDERTQRGGPASTTPELQSTAMNMSISRTEEVRDNSMLDASSDCSTVFEEGEALVVRLYKPCVSRRAIFEHERSEGGWSSSPTVHDSISSSPLFEKVSISAVNRPSIGLLATSLDVASQPHGVDPSIITIIPSREVCRDSVAHPSDGIESLGDQRPASGSTKHFDPVSISSLGHRSGAAEQSTENKEDALNLADSATVAEGGAENDDVAIGDEDNEAVWEEAEECVFGDRILEVRSDFRRRFYISRMTNRRTSVLSGFMETSNQNTCHTQPPIPQSHLHIAGSSSSDSAKYPRQVQVGQLMFDMVSPPPRIPAVADALPNNEESEASSGPLPGSNGTLGEQIEGEPLRGLQQNILEKEVGEELSTMIFHQRSLSTMKIMDAVRRRPGYSDEIRAENAAHSNDYFIRNVHDRFHSEGW